MDFLKDVLGEELYAQITEKIDAYNSNEANKDRQVKLANLSSGAYVSKDKYTALETDYSGSKAELEKANGLIAELQKATAGQEAVQGKIAEYEAKIKQQQEELLQAKTEAAVKVALLGAGAKSSDIDYLIYRLSHEPDWNPTLDEQGMVKGIDEKLSSLKTMYPHQFESGSSEKKIEEKKLERSEDRQAVSAEEFQKMGYQERLKLFNENPEAYAALTKS